MRDVQLYGDVLDFRVYYANPNVIIPNDLPPIAGATVRLPALGFEARTDGRGVFLIDLGQVASDCATDVIVTAPGFGDWVYRSAPILTYEHSGGYMRLFVALETKSQDGTYRHKLETPRPGCIRIAGAIRGAS